MNTNELLDLASDILWEWEEINRDNERWRVPPIGLDYLLDYLTYKGRIPEEVDMELLRFYIESAM